MRGSEVNEGSVDMKGMDSVAARNVRVTERDVEIRNTLRVKCRVLSINQIAELWWPNSKEPKNDAAKRMAKLEKAGHIEVREVVVHPPLEFSSGPLVTWKAKNSKEPDFGRVSYEVRKRWKETAVPTSVVTIPGGRKPRRVELSHDLSVAAIYVQLRKHQPELAANWLNEDEAVARGLIDANVECKPDAVICFPGDEKTLIELGGSGSNYTAKRLEAMHKQIRHSSYQIW